MNFEETLFKCVEKEVEEGVEKASERVQKSLTHISEGEIPFMIAVMENTAEQLRRRNWLDGKMADTIKMITNTEIIARKVEE